MFERASAIPLLCLVLAIAECGRSQQLVRDVNQNQPGAAIGRGLGNGLGDGQRIFFESSTPDTGAELWVSDGTTAGTHLVRDLAPGSEGPGVEPVLFLGGRLLFSTRAGLVRNHLWATDGTSAGTVPVSDAVVSNGQLAALGVLQGRGLFGGFGNDGIWSTDLTAAGTQLLATCALSGALNLSTTLGNRILFAATTPASGNEVWVTDGTSLGTHLLLDLLPGTAASRPGQFTTLGNAVFFLASDGNNRVQLWRTDGTAANTAPVLATTIDRDFDHEEMRAINGKLVMIVGGSLWLSDGTAAGTSLLLPSSGAGDVVRLFADATSGFCFRGLELWHTDATAAGTARMLAIPGNPGILPIAHAFVRGRAFIAVPGINAGHLVVSDGTAAGSSVQPEPFGVTGPAVFGAVGNRVVYAAAASPNPPASYRADQVLVSSDGTIAGRQVLLASQQPRPGVRTFASVSMDGVLYTFLHDGVHGYELWRSDGTASGTHLVVDLNPGSGNSMSPGSELVALDGALYFTCSPPPNGPSLWRSDGTAAGTVLLHGINTPGAPRYLQTVGHELYFEDYDPAQPFAWYIHHSDGTAAGTSRIATAQVAFTGGPFAVFDGVCVFTNPAGSLARSDGTAAGTYALPAPAARAIEVIDGRAVILAFSTTPSVMELWVSDGTIAGTQLLAGNLQLGSITGSGGGVDNAKPIRWQGKACWYGQGLLVCSDGTLAGTTQVNLPLPADVTGLVAAGNLLFGVGSDARSGRELWRTDGTVAGTHVALDLAPGPQNGVAEVRALGIGAGVWLSGSNGEDGLEPYVSDGTAPGTFRVADIAPQGSSNPQLLGVAGDRVYFLADDGTTGQELWSMPLAVAGNAAIESLGIGCAGTAGIPALGVAAAPRSGGALDLSLRGARPVGLAIFAFDMAAAPTVLPSGCVVRVGATAALAATFADNLGVARRAVAVPAAPALVGLPLTAQAVTFDPSGSALPGLAISNGLLLVIGR